MEQTLSVKLVEKSKATDFQQAVSEVVIDNKPTGITIKGQVLEASVKVDNDRYILFTTDDVIFEEFLTVTLISLSQGIVESLQVGNAYSSGSFEALSVNHKTIEFNFIGGSVWTIKVNAPQAPCSILFRSAWCKTLFRSKSVSNHRCKAIALPT